MASPSLYECAPAPASPAGVDDQVLLADRATVDPALANHVRTGPRSAAALASPRAAAFPIVSARSASVMASMDRAQDRGRRSGLRTREHEEPDHCLLAAGGAEREHVEQLLVAEHLWH